MKENIESPNEMIYLHDSDMISLKQSIDERNLEIVFENRYPEYMKRIVLKFVGTLFCELTSYCPWGYGEQVDSFYLEPPTLVERLHALSKEFGSDYGENLPKDKNLYIQPVISFHSGDRIRVLCTKVEAKEEQL